MTEIELTSTAKGRHAAQLVRYDAGHSAKEAIASINDWFEGEPLPEWVHLEGGVEAAAEGPATSLQILPAGQYVVFDTNSAAMNRRQRPSRSAPARAPASCRKSRRVSRWMSTPLKPPV